MIADEGRTPCRPGPQHRTFGCLEHPQQLGGGQPPKYKPASRAMVGTNDEGTEIFNYTTELYAYVRNGAPKRSGVASRRMVGRSNIGIHEDRVGGTSSVPGLGRHATSLRGSKPYEKVSTRLGAASKDSCLAQPAQTGPARATVNHSRAMNPRRRVSEMLAERQDGVEERTAPTSGTAPESLTQQHTIERKPRRMTIYIPSDDTTIQTIHPRTISCRTVISPKHQSLNGILPVSDLLNGRSEYVKASGENAKGPAVAIAATRVPLQTTSTFSQETTYITDRFGIGGGKENVPPARLKRSLGRSNPKRIVSNGHGCPSGLPTDLVEAVVDHVGNSGCGSTAASRTVRARRMDRCDIPESSRRLNTQLKKHGPRSTSERQLTQRIDVPTDRRAHVTWRRTFERRLSDLEKPLVTQSQQNHDEPYPLLSDISKPELYEENWLAHQEAATTQLVNCLFEAFEDDKCVRKSINVNLTRELVHLYQEAPFPILYQQVHASLLHGALSAPKGLTSSASRLESDIGLRREFLDLWMSTYELAPLQAATEAVIGRQLSEASKRSNAPLDGEKRRAKQEMLALRTFLSVFLVQNEDTSRMRHHVIEDMAHSHQTDIHTSTAVRLGQRTILRSFMLILLLDKAKHAKTISSRLFLPTSPHKSSVSVVNALTRMLLPSVGDVHRALRHLDYVVDHEQHPLQEYRYRILNLATDLRDGVRLTHLVDLLLYSSAAASRLSEDATITTLNGELSRNPRRQKECWALSSHLQVPCAAKSQKIHNVQIALNALSGLTPVSRVAKALRADDIVDGHREKTVGLLWALVSGFGLGTLVDWKELELETHRLQKRSPEDPIDCEADPRCQERFDEHASALFAWAGSIARLHQLDLSNIPTAFADGRIFEKVVDEYAVYLPYWQNEQIKISSKSAGLESKLRRLGCNRYFGKGPFQSAIHLLNPSVAISQSCLSY